MGIPVPDILLVDDNPDDRELAMRAFGRHGLAGRVAVAEDGVIALDLLLGDADGVRRSLPKVVLLDLNMPRVDGFEVLRRLRDDSRTRQLPVVVLTSSDEERDIARTYALGVNSYVVKPIDFDQYVQAVSELGFYWTALNRPPLS